MIKYSFPEEGSVRPMQGDWIKNGSNGWKIHLHVKKQNQKTIYDWLFDENNCPYGWKYLYADQEEKDFTIYIGSYDNALSFGYKLVKQLGQYLEEPTDKVLWSDIRLLPKIAARFCANTSSEFTNYGFLGIPSRKIHASILIPIIRNSKTPAERLDAFKKMVEQSHDILRKAYGIYYYGSGEDFVKRFVIPFLNGEPFNPNVDWHLKYARGKN